MCDGIWCYRIFNNHPETTPHSASLATIQKYHSLLVFLCAFPSFLHIVYAIYWCAQKKMANRKRNLAKKKSPSLGYINAVSARVVHTGNWKFFIYFAYIHIPPPRTLSCHHSHSYIYSYIYLRHSSAITVWQRVGTYIYTFVRKKKGIKKMYIFFLLLKGPILERAHAGEPSWDS